MSEERRGQSELRAHYEVERELAARLRSATRAERPALYSAVYDELFRRVGSHPQRQRHSDADVLGQLQALDRYLGRDSVFLEIGAGDCALSLAVADRVREVFAIEVSAEITAGVPRRPNLHVVITDGVSVPVPPAAATLAYSNQVFEHLHPDDALEHLRQVFGALQPGGRYVCITPNRLTGPHDISMHFDTHATGFHLQEYTATELAGLMRSAGFESVEPWATRKGISFRLPWPVVRATELLLGLLAHDARRRVGRALPFRIVLGCYVVGVKASAPAGSSSDPHRPRS